MESRWQRAVLSRTRFVDHGRGCRGRCRLSRRRSASSVPDADERKQCSWATSVRCHVHWSTVPGENARLALADHGPRELAAAAKAELKIQQLHLTDVSSQNPARYRL